MRRALLALLLIASPAWAVPTAHYVSVGGSTAGSTAWTNSTNSATPCALSIANGFATSGDSVMVADGPYSTSIAPSASGVIYVGNVASPASVSVAGVTPTNDTKVGGITSRGSVTFPRLARRVVIEDFAIAGGLDIKDAEACRVSRGSVSGKVTVNQLAIAQPGTHAQLDTLEDITITYTANTSLAMGLGTSTSDESELARVDRCLFRRMRFILAPTNTLHYGPIKMFRATRNVFEDIYIYYTPVAMSGSQNEPERGWVLRDSSAGNTFVRDTIIIKNAGKYEGRGWCLVSGNSPHNKNVKDNTFDACYVKIDKSPSAFWIQDECPRTKVTNSMFAVHTGTTFLVNPGDSLNSSEGGFFLHNTLYCANGEAYNFDQRTNTTPTQRYWAGNLHADRRATCSYDEDIWDTDSTLFWQPAQACSPMPGTANSFGNPLFRDTTWASLDLRVSSGSAAISGSFPDGYAGHAVYSAPPPSDTDAPAQVDDLSGAAVGTTSASLTWTAAGDDNRTGTATTTYVKRHTAAINTESDWTAATTIATINGGSNSTGGEQQSYTATGLAAANTYWFCVRSLDEVPNAGPVGNTISVTTSATPDTMPPSPIANLVASALTNTSVGLSWTAPGGDRSTGQASSYVIRYRAGTTLTDAQWAAATNVTVTPTPSPAGSFESWTVGGLSANTTYTFAIKSSDAVPNESVLSNAATVLTLGATPAPSPTAYNRRRRR